MNIKHEYFSNIIYQKQAVENLCGILKSSEKQVGKVFFVSSKTPYQMYGAQVVNQFNQANKEFVFQLIDERVEQEQAAESAKIASKCNVVVCLGGGSVIDFSKYIAKKIKAPLVIIPSSVGSTAPFSCHGYIKKNSIMERFECQKAHAILLDETLLKKCGKKNVQAGIDYILSFWDLVFNLDMQALLFGKKPCTSGLKMVLAKLQDVCQQKAEVDQLLIMDMLIDLGYFLKDISDENCVAFSLALLLKGSNAINDASFGKLCLVSGQILQACYEKYFSLKKLNTFNYLNLESLANALDRLKINPNKVCFSGVKSARVNHQLFLKINAVKNQVLAQLEKLEANLNCLSNQKVSVFYDFNRCLSAFFVLPYVYNCCPLTNLVFSSGLIVS